MKFLVTGATGFIGSHLSRRLAKEGHTVLALVRNPKKAETTLPKSNLEILQGDLSIFKNPDLEIPECDGVIHLAAIVTSKELIDYDRINREAAMDLVECVKRQRWTPKRFVFISSLAAGGPSPLDQPITEADECRPVDPYGQAKADAEAEMRANPFPTTACRPCIVLGPADPMTLSLFKAAKSRIGMRIAGRPQQVSFIDVDDLVDGIIKMAMEPGDQHEIYYAAYASHTDIQELWDKLGETFGRKVWVIKVSVKAMYVIHRIVTWVTKIFGLENQLDAKTYKTMIQPAFLCSSERLQTRLGWKPKVDLSASLKKAKAGYEELGWL